MVGLESTLRGEACDVWLHHVFSDLLEHKSKLLFAAGKDGGIVVRVCEASQVYCARLEKLALLEGRKGSVGVRGQGVKLKTPGSKSEEPDSSVGAALLEAVIMKVKNPQRYTFLTTSEAALYFRVTIRTIWRWNAEGKMRSGGRRGTITIESILRWEKKRSRKHASL